MGLTRRHQDFQFSAVIGSTPWLFNDLLAGELASTVTIVAADYTLLRGVSDTLGDINRPDAMVRAKRLGRRRTGCRTAPSVPECGTRRSSGPATMRRGGTARRQRG